MSRRIYFFIRVQRPVTALCGPAFKRDPGLIEIDITYDCNLRCFNCNRSCRQAPSKERMTVDQIKKFLKESADNNIYWKRIRVTGGEPALHPDIEEILRLLMDYKKDHSPATCVELVTNGYGEEVKRAIAEAPKGIIIRNSAKTSAAQRFCPFNVAPRDLIGYTFADYSSGCPNMTECGMGLTPFGYYPCAIMGGIDRVVGLDIGRKRLPAAGDAMAGELKALCRYCGRFSNGMPWEKTVTEEVISPSWREYYRRYALKKPVLTLY